MEIEGKMSDLTVFGEFDQYEINESYKSEKDARFIKWIKIAIKMN